MSTGRKIFPDQIEPGEPNKILKVNASGTSFIYADDTGGAVSAADVSVSGLTYFLANSDSNVQESLERIDQLLVWQWTPSSNQIYQRSEITETIIRKDLIVQDPEFEGSTKITIKQSEIQLGDPFEIQDGMGFTKFKIDNNGGIFIDGGIFSTSNSLGFSTSNGLKFFIDLTGHYHWYDSDTNSGLYYNYNTDFSFYHTEDKVINLGLADYRFDTVYSHDSNVKGKQIITSGQTTWTSFVKEISTTDDAPTELYQHILASGSYYHLSVELSGISDDFSEVFSGSSHSDFYNDGIITEAGSTNYAVYNTTDPSLGFSVTTSGIIVSGLSATNMNWSAYIKTLTCFIP